jgi:thiamine-monophosphate kinase
MPLGEFELIEHYFRQPAESMRIQRGDAPLGIGDDAAVLEVPEGTQLVAALDTLVEGRHFPRGTPPESLGHRALAVNLSDLAAMGADPAWFLLSLATPAAEPTFLEGLARGLFALANQHGIALVGGDTTAGPLTVSVQVLGLVPRGAALRRSGANAGDLLFVSGTPGDAAAGLKIELGAGNDMSIAAEQRAYLRNRFLFPEARVALGRILRGVASACIDVSDGLAADAGKLATASGCGARIEVAQLPLSEALCAALGRDNAQRAALCGGDDYELCFTVPPSRVDAMRAQMTNVKCRVTCIGVLDATRALRVFDNDRELKVDTRGYDHFAQTR